MMRWNAISAAIAAGAVTVSATPASAGQLADLSLELVATGLATPVAMVPHPGLDDTLLVLQQGGQIRIIQNDTLLPNIFLTVSPLSAGGERGLLGIAFDPDFETTRRFWVNHTNASGATVIARYEVSEGNPLQADASSRTEILTIAQPFANHNGGTINFGPDGYLYIGMGDGGSAGDPGNRAQNPSTLLGKMLRIDVRVPDSDPEGYDIPADNPFLPGNNPPVANALPEIWAFGVRNPWKWSFDDLGRDATGAMLMGDVGQNNWEEINYEPQGEGGRNYGWRIREGSNNFSPSTPPAFLPLTDPIFEYNRSQGGSTTGGYVYRGAAMCSYFGRYFYGDFVSGRVWSFHLENGVASDNINHTADLGWSGGISGFGRDANGEIYIIRYSPGQIYRIVSDDEPLGGDFTGDGEVGFSDLNTVLNNFGMKGGYDFSDLNAVLNNFGRSCG